MYDVLELNILDYDRLSKIEKMFCLGIYYGKFFYLLKCFIID